MSTASQPNPAAESRPIDIPKPDEHACTTYQTHQRGETMTRKSTPLQGDAPQNGQIAGGDAQEPDTSTDTSFDPTKLDRSTQPAGNAGPDPFDPASLRLSQDFAASVGVKKALLTVPVRKPDKSWFVRVHPDQSYRLQTAVIELKEDRESYLVVKELWPDLATEATFKPKLLVTAINRQGVLFLWELNLPRTDGRVDEWTRSALEAAELATKAWVRVTANMSLGAYEVAQAASTLLDPEWPEKSFKELLRIAFKDRFINDPNHPVLRRLRGEV
jgi:hypothetical protein